MEKPDHKVTFMAVGDIMLGDSPVCHGFGVNSMIQKYGPLHPFEHVSMVLREGDIVFGNLEVPVSRFDEKVDSFERVQFRGQPESIKGLVASGFDVVSVCSNHTMQHGKVALVEMVEHLNASGIEFVGVEDDEPNMKNLCILERQGVRFAFLAYNFRPQQYFLDPPSWKTPSLELIKKETHSVADSVDHVIVSLHWGDEFVEYPSPKQVRMAHDLIDHGVTLVVGHHPHIVQGVEQYKDGLIAYSLGNFVFDMWQLRLRETMILRCVISKEGVETYELIPASINSFHQPVILEGADAEHLAEKFQQRKEMITGDQSVETEYAREVEKKTKEFRAEIRSFYLKHLHKYEPKRFIENLVSAVRKRVGRGN